MISNKDPITGLVEFAQDVKPYHTKIIEVLVDYIYEETMNVNVSEDFAMAIKSEMDLHTDYCFAGYGTQPWDETYIRPLDPSSTATIQVGSTNVDVVAILLPDVFLVEGDQTLNFSVGDIFTVSDSFGNDGNWEVIGTPQLTTTTLKDEDHQPYSVVVTAVQVRYVQEYLRSIQNIIVPKIQNASNTGLQTNCGITVDTFGVITVVSTGEQFETIMDWCITKLFPITASSLPCFEFLFENEITNLESLSSAELYNLYGIRVQVGGQVDVYRKMVRNHPEHDILIETFNNLTEWWLNRVFSSVPVSNYDFPETCPYTSPTTASTRINEDIEMDITMPSTKRAQIVYASASTGTMSGFFWIKNPDPSNTSSFNNFGSSDYTNAFPHQVRVTPHNTNEVPPYLMKPVITEFMIQGSGNNDGDWTVKTCTYDSINDVTVIIPVESVPRVIIDQDPPAAVPDIVEPLGFVVADIAEFRDTLSVEIAESTGPAAWEFYYFSSPTSPIQGITIVDNSINVRGDLRRFFRTNSRLTIHESKKATTIYRTVDAVFDGQPPITINDSYELFETVNTGAWAWTVLGAVYDSSQDVTTIAINEPLYTPGLDEEYSSPFGFVSGQPTFIRGVGWGEGGWSTEVHPWITVVDGQLLAGSDFVRNTNYDLFVNPQGAFDGIYFDLGGFDDILQQILPL